MPNLESHDITPPSGALASRLLHGKPPSTQKGPVTFRLLSYNIQVGIASSRYHHYLTGSWKHLLPHPTSFENLDSVAGLVTDFDMVAVQEADAGSFRSYFTNQVEYLSSRGHFPFWYHQTNRNMGKFAQHSMGLLSKQRPADIIEHKLPGIIPGRGVMEARYHVEGTQLTLLLVHLGLSKRARFRQLDYISELVNNDENVVVMGDFNCQAASQEMERLINRTHLTEPVEKMLTFPSWRPVRSLDHILVSNPIQVKKIQVLKQSTSDHLPIAVDISVRSSHT
ncbi:MAG: endonuclease/exonuclease/phosphatase family protein [Gammaproteobacteria bacterium]